MIGFGLAFAILIDAIVIRLVLVPALMHIVGPAMWWMPSWLEKRLPHLNIEPPDEPRPAGAPVGPPQPQPASG